jgi:hypothetical protein
MNEQLGNCYKCVKILAGIQKPSERHYNARGNAVRGLWSLIITHFEYCLSSSIEVLEPPKDNLEGMITILKLSL